MSGYEFKLAEQSTFHSPTSDDEFVKIEYVNGII